MVPVDSSEEEPEDILYSELSGVGCGGGDNDGDDDDWGGGCGGRGDDDDDDDDDDAEVSDKAVTIFFDR